MLSGKMQSATYVKPDVIAVSHKNAPYITAYPWYEDGFGTKFSDPSTPPVSNGGGIAFHPSGNAVAVASAGTTSSTTLSVYQWEGLGFGAKYVNPTDLINPSEVLFSPDGNVIFAGLSAYAWSSSGFGAPYTNFTVDYAAIRSISMNAPGTAFAFSHFTRGNAIYGVRRWSNATGWGTAYAATPYFWAFAFSPDNAAAMSTLQLPPYVAAYQWSDATGLGTQYANPAVAVGGLALDCTFSPDGSAVAFARSGTPYVEVYAWSGAGFGTKYANPAVPAGFYGERVAFNGSGTALAVASGNTSATPAAPPVTVYQWSSAGFGTKFADPAIPPTGDATGVTFLSSTT